MKKITLVLFAIFSFWQINAQVNSYSFSQSTGTYTPITGGSVLGTATNDDTSFSALPIGFTFNYNSVDYTQFSVNANGFIALGATITTSYSCLSSGTTNNVIAPFNADLQGDATGELSYLLQGTSPNQTLTIQWKNYKSYGTTGVGDNYNFQIILHETTNVIDFAYGTVVQNATNRTRQVGLRGQSNTSFSNRTTTTDWSSTNPGVANTATCTLTSVIVPASGLTYTWTPPTCPGSTGMTVSNISANGATVTWIEPVSIPSNGYEYSITSSVTPPTGAGTASATNSATVSSLMSNTTYYVYVRSICGTDIGTWVLVGNFKTLCDQVTDFVENFDSYPTGTTSLPDCWSKLGTSSNVYITSGGATPMSPANRLYMNISSTTTAFAVLPPVSNLQANSHRLKLKAYCTTTGKVLSIGYLTVSGDVTSFVEVEPIQLPGTNLASTQEFSIVPTGIPAGVNQLVLRIVPGASTTVYIDDVKWEVNSSCVEPNTLSASNITNSSADLAWIAGGLETEWEIQYGLQNFTIGTGTIITNVTNNPYALNSLMSNTTYQFYVRATCSGPVYSSWAGPFTFKTKCDDLTEYTENFDSYATGSANPMPDCWSRAGTGSVYITTGASAPMSPSNRLYMFASGTTPTEGYAILPAVSNLQANTHRLKFKAYATLANRFIELGYVTDPNDMTTFIQLVEISLPGTNLASTQEFTIIPTGIPTGVKHLVIKNPGFPSSSTTAYIDDVKWEAIPSCPEPDMLTVGTIVSDSAVLSWTEMGSSSLWNIEYGATGFTLGSGTLVSGVTTNPYTLSALTPATTYDYYVQSDCGSTDGTSIWIGPYTFTTACVPFAAPFNENFDSLALTTPYTAMPNCWDTQVGPDFWDVTNGSTNSAQYLPGVVDHTTTTGNFMWIDASGDITANEMVSPLIDMSTLTSPYAGFWFASNNTSNTINHTIALDVWDGSAWLNIATETGNFTEWVQIAAVVPSSVPTTTKFRIYAIANPNGTSSDYYFNDLGVDDFFVVETPSCPFPVSLSASNTTSSSVDLAWTESGSATLWNIEYGPLGFTPGTGTIVSGVATNPYTLGGLTPATNYSYYVQSDCNGTSGTSTWSGPFPFTTECVAFVAPFNENFDSLALVSPFTELPSCWDPQVGPDFWDVTNDLINTGHTYLPDLGDHTTGNSNYLWIDSSSDITANQLVTPLIDMSALTTPYAGFWFASNNTNNTINHTIALDVWDGTAWLNLATQTGNYSGWVQIAVVVPSTVPSTTKFRIHAIANPNGTSSDYFYNDLGVDDFFVVEAPTTAPGCATNIVATPNANCGNEATIITWDAVAGATGHYLTVGTTSGGNDVIDNLDISSTPNYSLTGLVNTTYYYTITPYNTVGSATGCTEQSFTTVATGCYCPSVPTSLDASGITNVQLGTTDFPNGAVTYFDHTAITVDFAQGASANTQITFNTSIYDYNTVIWIDFNNDYNFDASEIVYTGVSGTTSPNTLNASYLMPATANLGVHRMRIVATDALQTPSNPCYSASYGVALDFSVNITPLLSVNDFDKSSFMAYPNPVIDVLNLSYSTEITSIQVVNLLGQEVISRKIGSTSTQIDMSNLTAGAYIVNVSSGDVLKSIKVIKQ